MKYRLASAWMLRKLLWRLQPTHSIKCTEMHPHSLRKKIFLLVKNKVNFKISLLKNRVKVKLIITTIHHSFKVVIAMSLYQLSRTLRNSIAVKHFHF